MIGRLSFTIQRWTLCLLFIGTLVVAPMIGRPRDVFAKPSPASQATTDIVELAARFENGEGVDRDFSRALTLYCQAADQGDAKASLSLGWMYLNGRGVAIDDGIAVRWFKIAANRGIPQATNLLQTMSGIAPSAKTGCPSVLARPVAGQTAPSPEISAIVERAANEAGVDPNLVMAIIRTESEFNSHAVSPRNAQGLMQLMPATAVRYHVANTFDPLQNVRGGTAYLRWLLDRFDGDLKLALAAYNAGENAVTARHDIPRFPETQKYVASVTRLYGEPPGSTPSTASGLGNGALTSTLKTDKQRTAVNGHASRAPDPSRRSNLARSAAD